MRINIKNACRNGDLNSVKTIVFDGGGINSQDDDGNSLLLYAA